MKQYFIHNGRTESGPFDLEQLKQMHIKKDFFIWYEGLQKWVRASSVTELQELLSDSESMSKTEDVPVLDLSKRIKYTSNRTGKTVKKHIVNPDSTKKMALTIWVVLSILFLIAMYLYLRP